MSSSREWTNEIDLMEMYGIDTETEGAKDFSMMCCLTSMFLRFPEFGCGYYDVLSKRLRELRWSPMVYYARIRKSIRPLLDAGREQLSALGLQIEGEGDAITVPALAKAISAVLAPEVPESDRENVRELKEYVAKPEKKKAAGQFSEKQS